MTFKQKFGKISKKLVKADTSKFDQNFAIQITMDDEDCGGTFFVAYIDGAYRVEPYDYVDNTASVNIMSDKLEKLIDKELSASDLASDSVMRVEGNVNHVISLFEAFEKKAVKKPAAKKTVKKVEKKVEKKEEKPVKKETAKKEPVKKATVKKEEPKKAEEKKEESKKAETKKTEPVKTVEKVAVSKTAKK